jgi:hypothetical protein
MYYRLLNNYSKEEIRLYIKLLVLVPLLVTLLTGCFERDPLAEMDFDGVYIDVEGSNNRFITLVNREEDAELACLVGRVGPPCSKKIYGFKKEYFASEITEEELKNSVIYVKYTKAAEDFNLKIGVSVDAKDKWEKPSWETHYCHSTQWRLSAKCIGGDSGFKDKITTFRVKKLKEGFFKFEPTKDIPKGNYFFWFQTSKSSGFSQGFPFKVI